MKKILIIGTLVIAAVLAFGAIGVAYAQTATPNQTGTGLMAGGRGGMRGQAGDSLLQDYMLAGFATAFDMQVADLQVRIEAGDTMYDVALELGYTQETFSELMVTVRTDAINQALADGVITQEQADWMLSRLSQRAAGGFGTGVCTGDCQSGTRMGRSGGMGMSRGGGNGTGTCIQP